MPVCTESLRVLEANSEIEGVRAHQEHVIELKVTLCASCGRVRGCNEKLARPDLQLLNGPVKYTSRA